MMNSSGLSLDTLSSLNSVFHRYQGISKVILYGSRAKGCPKSGSDIDITLMGSHLSWRELTRIECELDDLLLPYELDISNFDDIDNSELIEHIKRVGKVIYERQETHADRCGNTNQSL